MNTKAELMQAHREGRLQPVAYFTMTNTSSLVILHMDDYAEKVFGYSAYGQDVISSRDYFYVKLNTSVNGLSSFRIGGLTVQLEHCMRA